MVGACEYRLVVYNCKIVLILVENAKLKLLTKIILALFPKNYYVHKIIEHNRNDPSL